MHYLLASLTEFSLSVKFWLYSSVNVSVITQLHSFLVGNLSELVWRFTIHTRAGRFSKQLQFHAGVVAKYLVINESRKNFDQNLVSVCGNHFN